MRAIGYRQAGGADVLEWLDLPEPAPRARDLIVRVKAVSVNPVDVKVRASATPSTGVPRVLGFDAVGVIEQVGSDVTFFAPGDEVFYAGSIDRPGTNGELHAVDERIVGRKPTRLSWTDAAALPLTSLTAWELLFDRMRVPYGAKTGGGTLLVINGAGGVGSILTQLARRLTGLTVVATASRPESAEWCRRMGAHHIIDHHQPLDEELARIGIAQAEYVAGLTATEAHLPAIERLIAPQGVLALIDDPDQLDIVPFKRKSVTVAWELMFTRPLFDTPDLARQGFILNEVAALIDAGLLVTTANESLGDLTPATLAEGHRRTESGRAIGKTVMSGVKSADR